SLALHHILRLHSGALYGKHLISNQGIHYITTIPSLNAVCIHIRDSGSASESRAPTLVPHIHLPWSGGGPVFPAVFRRLAQRHPAILLKIGSLPQREGSSLTRFAIGRILRD